MTLPLMPVNAPAECLNIDPESMDVANAYLQTPDIQTVANDLDISTELVTQILARREVKAYVDQVFHSIGFNNRFRMRHVMDTIIKRKLQDLDEADTSSTKDITEILALSHKMSMEHLAAEMAVEKLRQSKVVTQTNIQVNDTGGSNYTSLLKQLLNDV
jgi:hypothetical protein